MPRFDWTRDEVVLAADLIAGNRWRALRARDPKVIELSRLLRGAAIHPVDGRPPNFRSPNSIQRKTYDITTQHPDYGGQPTKGGPHDASVLMEFIDEPERMAALALALRAQIEQIEQIEQIDSVEPPDLDVGSLAAHEGRALAVVHLRRERSVKLREAKIAAVRATGSDLACEVCRFEFAAQYGALGEGYIEVHHVLPLHASGPVLTRLEDLALICSNCHRMLHRAHPWLRPDELRARLGSAARREG